jgi:nucleolar protein 56
LFTTHRGLGHAYSRAKIKHNVNKADNMIIQSFCLLDQLDKDVNTLCMRIKEWYSWHFPELGRIVKDNVLFARVAYLIKNKANFDESKVPEIAEILNDPDLAQAVFSS